MEFEDMQKVWNSQSQQPLYVMDEKAMHKRVNDYQSGVVRMGSIVEIGLVVVALFVAVFYGIEGILADQLYQLPGSAIFLGVAVYVVRTRSSRKAAEGNSDRTVLGDLNLSIRSLEYQIRRQKRFIWWFMAPAFLLILIQALFSEQGKPWYVWLMMAVAGGFGYWLTRWELNAKLLPKLKKLRNLRQLLMADS